MLQNEVNFQSNPRVINNVLIIISLYDVFDCKKIIDENISYLFS